MPGNYLAASALPTVVGQHVFYASPRQRIRVIPQDEINVLLQTPSLAMLCS